MNANDKHYIEAQKKAAIYGIRQQAMNYAMELRSIGSDVSDILKNASAIYSWLETGTQTKPRKGK